MTTDDSLKPCPFCGAGTTEITPNGRMWTGMKYSEPSSVSVRHWCDSVPGQPSRMLERVGRDEVSAIEAWNTRALLAAQPAQERQTYKPGNGGDCAICRQPEGDHYRHGNDCPDMRGVGQAE